MVTIVILNWNGQKKLDINGRKQTLLEAFLPKIVETVGSDGHILFVDNASTDDSVEFVRNQFPSIEILALDKNYGFAEGNNRALPLIKTPYFLLLNSDVEVTDNWLKPMLAAAETDPNIAIVQPKILAQRQKDSFEYAGAAGGWIDKYGYPFCRGRIFDSVEKDQHQYDTAEEIFWASGACMLIRTEIAQKYGLFDPYYFAHMEEIDFCWRIKNQGYKVWFTPESTVFHVGGATLNYQSPRKAYLNFRNSLASLLKNLPMSQTFPKIFIRLCLDGVAFLRELLAGRLGASWAIFCSHIAFYWMIPYCLRQRKLKLIPLEKHSGTYCRSIVWDFFAQKINTFSLLKSTAKRPKKT